jgi:predicted GNAT superfamily acetyltransferase
VADIIEIRPLHSNAECQAAATLQREVWGQEYVDVVPATLLHVVEYVGGLAAGAFDRDGDMLGFVFGVNGVRDGEIVHWSHMLGVRERARNLGLGRRLKEYQRQRMHAIGATRIFWSFDPLMSKNAYFNLNRLGAEVVEYVPDMYGTTSSPLHLGMPTDRLIVSLRTDGRAGQRSAVLSADHPVLSAFPRDHDRPVPSNATSAASVLIEIPADILGVLARSTSTAEAWRMAVRAHFQWALANGYAIAALLRDPLSDRSFYLATRESGGARLGERSSTTVNFEPRPSSLSTSKSPFMA